MAFVCLVFYFLFVLLAMGEIRMHILIKMPSENDGENLCIHAACKSYKNDNKKN